MYGGREKEEHREIERASKETERQVREERKRNGEDSELVNEEQSKRD